MFRIHLDQLYTHVLYKSISEQHNQFDEKLYTVAKNKCNTKWLTINQNKATGMHLSSPFFCGRMYELSFLECEIMD